jgi:hypothetical protein
MMSEETAEAILRHRHRNQSLKRLFEEKGINLDEPRPTDFHFWAWSQRDAAVLGKRLYEMGFLIRLLAPASIENDPDRWSVEAGAKIPLAESLGDSLTEKLVHLAAAEDAVFDGWGTSV